MRILGINKNYVDTNGIKKMTMKLYFPEGYDATRVLVKSYLTDGTTKEIRLNASNLGGSFSKYYAMYDANGNRIYEITASEQATWVTLEINLVGVATHSSNSALNVEISTQAVDTYCYVSDVRLSRLNMGEGII